MVLLLFLYQKKKMLVTFINLIKSISMPNILEPCGISFDSACIDFSPEDKHSIHVDRWESKAHIYMIASRKCHTFLIPKIQQNKLIRYHGFVLYVCVMSWETCTITKFSRLWNPKRHSINILTASTPPCWHKMTLAPDENTSCTGSFSKWEEKYQHLKGIRSD